MGFYFEDEDDDIQEAIDDSIVDIARGPGYAHVNMDGQGPNTLISDQQPSDPMSYRANMVGDGNPNLTYAPMDPDSGWNYNNVKASRIYEFIKIAGLEDVLTDWGVSEEVKQFILSLPNNQKQYYVAAVRQNPQIEFQNHEENALDILEDMNPARYDYEKMSEDEIQERYEEEMQEFEIEKYNYLPFILDEKIKQSIIDKLQNNPIPLYSFMKGSKVWEYSPNKPTIDVINIKKASFNKSERLLFLNKIAKLTAEQKEEIKSHLNKVLNILDEENDEEEIPQDPMNMGTYQSGAYDNYAGTLNQNVGATPSPGGGWAGWGMVDTSGYNQL